MGAPDDLRAHLEELEQATGIQGCVTEDGSRVFVVLNKVVLPPGLFQAARSDILFVTDHQYPLSAMDMFWTELDVVRPDGSIPQNADLIEQYLGREWRRFSWHRNSVWNPRGNPLLDHFALVEARWALEATR